MDKTLFYLRVIIFLEAYIPMFQLMYT